METGVAQQIGLAREFIVTVPTAGEARGRNARRPYPDEVARALADEDNLRQFVQLYDPHDLGLRDMWEIVMATGRRVGEVVQVRWDCLGRYNELPMFWHDQTKVGNYDVAIRIPERLHDVIAERQRKTLDRFTAHHGRRPSGAERGRLALFPTTHRNHDGTQALSYHWFTRGSRRGSQHLTSATACRIRPAIPWPPISYARVPASPTSALTWARSVTVWPNTMCTCPIRISRMCCNRSGLLGPAWPTPVNFSRLTRP